MGIYTGYLINQNIFVIKVIINTSHTLRQRLNTCTDHGDWRFYIYPFISIYTRVNKDKTIKMSFLNSTKSIFNSIIILEEKGQVYREVPMQRYRNILNNCFRNIPTYFLFLCISQDYCRSVQQNLALHVLLCTETRKIVYKLADRWI